ncbi:MAG: STAS domain-containing protein [Candidatus Kapaibacterium sp.]
MMVSHQNAKAASIQLGTNVLGGADAVEFSTLVRELGEKGVTTLVIDMSNVQIMNSSGLGMLVASLSTMRKFGGTVKFAAVPEKVQTLLTMTHLNSVFQMYPTTQEALDSQ